MFTKSELEDILCTYKFYYMAKYKAKNYYKDSGRIKLNPIEIEIVKKLLKSVDEDCKEDFFYRIQNIINNNQILILQAE